jgi:hypothetical protein
MKSNIAMLIALFLLGVVLGSLFVPMPRFRSESPGLVLDTWTGTFDSYGEQRKRAQAPALPIPTSN